MVTARIHWGSAVTEVTNGGGRLAAWIADVARQLDEGRRSGAVTFYATKVSVEIPYAQIRRVELIWSPS